VTAVLGKGTGIGQGAVSGRARIAQNANDLGSFNAGEILVVSKTSADFVEVIRKASGIVTEEDSITSHAAVIGLRLGVPVIVGVQGATEIIRDGTILTLDMQRGLVYSGMNSAQTDAALSV
jgi:pyruvate kinase